MSWSAAFGARIFSGYSFSSSCGEIAMWGLMPPVFFASFAAIGWQLALMRCLLISRYHHFSFLVISCALLGFGTGGVVLSLGTGWFRRHSHEILRWVLLSFGISLPVCFRLGESLPLNVYFVPSTMLTTITWWCLFWVIHGVPFLLAGIFIGGALMTAGTGAHRVYAVNLVGSAAGALGVIALMDQLPAQVLVIPIAALVLFSGCFLCAPWLTHRDAIYGTCLALACLGLGATCFLEQGRLFPLHIDQYKPLAHVLRLERQGSAHKEITLYSERGRVDVYASPTFHTLLSLSPLEKPPPMRMLLRDGFEIGSLLSISRIEQALFLESTLAALPYKLIEPKRVLVLGATDGHYIWLARLSRAESIVVVQPDANIAEVLRRYGSNVLDDPRIHLVQAEPRAYLDSTSETFDVVHLAAMEGFLAGSGGIGSLREDYLGTVEGFAACLCVLSDRGLVSVVRGIQEPERDNIKIAATWIAALEKDGVKRPGDCMLISRDELAVSTLASRSPVSRRMVGNFREVARVMSWEAEWFPGVSPEETNRIHVLPGPEGTSVSWYHQAMRKLLSAQRVDFLNSWIAQVRPATDDKPFFSDFFRWDGVRRLREVFGPMWATRSEMGFLVLVLSSMLTLAFATVLLPLPILLFGAPGIRGTWLLRFSLVTYFALLGTGFMFVEMGFISVFTRLLGDPIPAAALVVAGLLLAAGLGSMAQPTVTRTFPWGACGVALCTGLIVAAYGLALPLLFAYASALTGVWKNVLGLVALAPMAFLMGVPFPWGLSVLHRVAVQGVPLAWAVNGFASVVSASVAVVLAMTWGFSVLLGFAAALYGLAGLVSLLLKASDTSLDHQ
jgi:hypothetical protein